MLSPSQLAAVMSTDMLCSTPGRPCKSKMRARARLRFTGERMDNISRAQYSSWPSFFYQNTHFADILNSVYGLKSLQNRQ